MCITCIASSVTGQILLLLFMPLSMKVKKKKVVGEKKKRFVFTAFTALCVFLLFSSVAQGAAE